MGLPEKKLLAPEDLFWQVTYRKDERRSTDDEIGKKRSSLLCTREKKLTLILKQAAYTLPK